MRRVVLATIVIVLGTGGLTRLARADSDYNDDLARIKSAKEVFQEIITTPDSTIPENLLENTECIAIIPGELKFAFVFGGNYGKGLVTCRTPEGWSAPVFVMVGGGSFGFQIGGSATDIVMLFMNQYGVQHLLSDNFKIGADVAAAAGPVGRHAAAATDIEMHAEILTYSRSRGVFAGISLDGAVVKPDESGDEALYGRNADREKILEGKVAVPKEALALVNEIAQYTGEPKERIPSQSKPH